MTPTILWRGWVMLDDPNGGCLDCGIATTPDDGYQEYYMVHDEIWPLVSDGMLCIICLERRIGRQLNPADFTDAPINDFDPDDTRRLLHRKGFRWPLRALVNRLHEEREEKPWPLKIRAGGG